MVKIVKKYFMAFKGQKKGAESANGTNSSNDFHLMYVCISDEFDLKFPELSQAELKGSRAESSQAGAFQFSS